ncbi:hypothetical protein Xvie_01508 [Xenorhabdus vietnamensis]|uniref:Uncharacterized protein n=1 Tax=Xenorhabdus vietnamensis TaxID=351656 RepID=A0A1Y2SDK0_9GAMM|nr:hypothetical protein Xvie_01508 [Xenorhabdus vietnamensis]
MYRSNFGTRAYLIVLGVDAKSSGMPDSSSSGYGGSTFEGSSG